MKSQFYTTSHTRTAAGHPLTPSESQADTCKQTRSRPALGDRPSLAHTLSVHGMRGNHHPFSTFPHARCCAAGQSSRGRSRPGKVRRHRRSGGRLSPRPENATFLSHPARSPPREQGGAARAAPRTARADVQRHCIFSGRLGVPHAKITLHFAKSWIFPLATRWPAFSGEAKYEHSLSTREQSGRPRLERQPRSCARDDTIFTDRGNAIWLNLPEEQADLKD